MFETGSTYLPSSEKKPGAKKYTFHLAVVLSHCLNAKQNSSIEVLSAQRECTIYTNMLSTQKLTHI